jgi:hypothetical protein
MPPACLVADSPPPLWVGRAMRRSHAQYLRTQQAVLSSERRWDIFFSVERRLRRCWQATQTLHFLRDAAMSHQPDAEEGRDVSSTKYPGRVGRPRRAHAPFGPQGVQDLIAAPARPPIFQEELAGEMADESPARGAAGKAVGPTTAKNPPSRGMLDAHPPTNMQPTTCSRFVEHPSSLLRWPYRAP